MSLMPALSPVLDFILSNTPPPEFNPDTVTPGPWGFFAIFFVAAVTLLLGMDLARRIRRTNYRAEMQERLAAEVAERDAAAGEKKSDEL
ncbi:hypothetical protein [Cryobacterium sp. PAMC25264]|uniref:hypothetical protein n=1 Tax=Cryobacterium sp. PAMC25264 TaxID=2861288 RepID=UPI001C6317D6|nr:hypothetical protein [Cryobacterium sp. PAMC25264]QYF72147.1 hypothetical protein KY500_09685 [Cryobacterium sp. PAMC25264]